ncbi:Uncharacterised protein [Klebsiella pneumoniae]|uniref:Uncharacterized protein n=1 Tax=Klebsiella pneumoniae TaxID=573 RepID=A0A377TQF1_KLEPN|nr:Uncharacterised protein [Klebsiella pneumoniae]
MSVPPSPYLVKKPVIASAAWSVPTTTPLVIPAMLYWALHSLTGFFIAANEVAQFDACFAQRLFAGQHRSFNIDCQHPIRLDKCDGVLAVLLISLHAHRVNGRR